MLKRAQQKVHKLLSSLMRRIVAMLPQKKRFAVMRSFVDCDTHPTERLVLKIAETKEELEACFALLHDAYVDSGFMTPDPSGMRVTIYHALPTTTTLCAKFDGKVVGTISLIRESALGFPLQRIFDLTAVRAKEGNIAEVSALAVHPRFRRTGGSILFPLMKFMYEYCTTFFDTRHLVIAVNPNRIEMYESLLFFQRLTANTVDNYDFANGAPAVGASLDLSAAPAAALPHWQLDNDWLITPSQLNAHAYYAHCAREVERNNQLVVQGPHDGNGADPLRIMRVSIWIGAAEQLPAYRSAQTAYHDHEHAAQSRLHVFETEQIALGYERELAVNGVRPLLPPRIIALLEQPAAFTLLARAYAANRLVEQTAINGSGRPNWRNYALIHTPPDGTKVLLWLTEYSEEGAARQPASLLEAARAFCLELHQRHWRDDPPRQTEAELTQEAVRADLEAWITQEADRTPAAQKTGLHWQRVGSIQRNRPVAAAAAAWIDRLTAAAARLEAAADSTPEGLFRRVLALHSRRCVAQLRLNLQNNFV